ncbi:MAG: T9SS type A sorting domain-containing protein [Bacteroidales bacterium]|nr:T9SS type A sorting domain-containing protein [Bacteroidales bacterium]
MKTHRSIIVLCLTVSITVASAQEERITSRPCIAGSEADVSKGISHDPAGKGILLPEFDSLNMTFTGNWGLGQSYTIHCSPSGDTVFVGSGAAVLVFDASDPYQPEQISEIRARALVDGCYYEPESKLLYLAAYFSGLEIWDLSDMTLPKRLSRTPVNGLPRGGIFVTWDGTYDHHYAYLVTVTNGVEVFHVGDPSNPWSAGSFSFTSALLWSSFCQGDTLFLAAGNSGTIAIDISSGTSPAQAFTIGTPTTTLQVKGTLAYILNSSFGLRIFDFSQLPATQTGFLALDGTPYRLSLSGQVACVANSTTNPGGGINMVDVGDPSAPEHVGDYPGYQTFICSSNEAACSTGGTEGCLFLDITDPQQPVKADTCPLPSSVWDIAVSGDHAYLGSNGFRVFDITDKTHPVQVGYDETQGALVKVSGDVAVYCPESMGSSNRVNFMDITDPSHPFKISHYICPWMTNDLDITGHYAVVACWWDGIRIIDFENPAAPVQVAHEMGWVNGAVPGEEYCYAQAVDVEDGILCILDYGPFTAEDTRGIYTFDITDPAAPVFLNRFTDWDGDGRDIKVFNGMAYVAGNEGGFSIVNVSDPSNPYQVSYFPLGDAAWAVDLHWPFAFVANYILEGVTVVDVSDPYAPSVAGYYKRTGCFAVNVTYSAGHVFVADGPAGFGIYRFNLLSGEEEAACLNGPEWQVMPNPLAGKGQISFRADRPGEMMLRLYDISGRLLSVVASGSIGPGHHMIPLDPGDLGPGVYLLRIRFGEIVQTRKVVVTGD